MKSVLKLSILSLCFLFSYINSAEVPKEFIALFLPENPIVVDAGAYNGKDTCEMSRLWPKGMIFSFEPVPHIFKQLKDNTRTCANVVCIEKALSDMVGSSYMYLSSGGDQSSSLLEPTGHLSYFPHITFNKKITVETITLDKFAKDMNIDHIDFLWFDLQGMEPMVLEKCKILKTVKVVYTEVSYTDLYKDAPLYPEFKVWMEEQGFVVVKEVMHHSTFGDALFVRKELIKD